MGRPPWFKCPKCRKAQDFILPEGTQIIDIHLDDFKLGLEKGEIVQKCSKCKNKDGRETLFHIVTVPGQLIENWRHPFENFIDFGIKSKKIDKDKASLSDVFSIIPDIRYLFAFLIGFALFSFIPIFALLIINRVEFIGRDFSLLYGVLGGILLIFYIKILREIKSIGGEVETYFPDPKQKEDIYKHSLEYMTSRRFFLLTLFIIYIPLVLDNLGFTITDISSNSVKYSWIIDLSLIGRMLIAAAGFQIFTGYAAFLAFFGANIKKNVSYFEMQKIFYKLSSIGLLILFITALAFFIKTIDNWILLSSSFRSEVVHPVSMILFSMVFPIALVIITFVIFMYFIHTLMIKVKNQNIDDENNKLKKLKSDHEKTQKIEDIKKISNKITWKKEFIERLENAPEWPINKSNVAQLVISLVVVASPWVLRYFDIIQL